MRPLVLVLACFSACLALPASAGANHAACGAEDGYVVDPDVKVWLTPGCVGASYDSSTMCTIIDVLHVNLLKLTVTVMHDCETGVWLA